MPGEGAPALLRVGRIGRAHGLAGEFRVEEPTERPGILEAGQTLTVEGIGEFGVDTRKGSDGRPILRLTGLDPSEARGRPLLVPRERIVLEVGEWLADDLVGCEVPGVGAVTGIWSGPSAEALEIDGGRLLIPLVADAIRSIDVEGRTIEVDRAFLGIG